MNKNELIEAIKGELIVSCQALPEEPLHSSYIMGRMAFAAKEGGAKGIRANSVEDIKEIKKTVDLPIIGIIKSVYDGYDVFITPTFKEIDALYKEGVDIIAIDATDRIRPDDRNISDVYPEIKVKYPDQLFMADCATYDEAKEANRLGFDFIGTTLSGYTEQSEDRSLPDIELMTQIAKDFSTPIIAEGGIWSPTELKVAFDAGVHCAVVGSAITRPMEITKRFVRAIK